MHDACFHKQGTVIPEPSSTRRATTRPSNLTDPPYFNAVNHQRSLVCIADSWPFQESQRSTWSSQPRCDCSRHATPPGVVTKRRNETGRKTVLDDDLSKKPWKKNVHPNSTLRPTYFWIRKSTTRAKRRQRSLRVSDPSDSRRSALNQNRFKGRRASLY